jgi:hypothetical protein
MAPAESLDMPWSTAPSGRGAAMCDWCGRSIYRPATPCSLADRHALLAMITSPGAGARCDYEARTRGVIPNPAN